jgi:hypothetical protein
VEFDVKSPPELFNVPSVALAGVVPREVGRRDIGDGFIADADNL